MDWGDSGEGMDHFRPNDSRGHSVDDFDAPLDPEPRTRLRRLNINLLYALDALLSSQSLTAAAHSIALSQPAMSAKLRQLRDHFGDELILYGDRRRLTALGEALSPRVGRVLREVDDTFHLTLDFNPATARQTITIAAPEIVELPFFSRLIPELHDAAPGITLRAAPFVPGSVRRMFDAGVDVAIVPDGMVDPALNALPIDDQRLTCMVCKHHPLAEGEVSAEAYLAARHAAVDDHIESAMFGRFDARHPIARRNVVVRTGLHSMLPMLAMQTDLIVTTSNWFAQYCAAYLPVALCSPMFPVPSSQLVVQWQPYRAEEPMIRWLIDQMMLARNRIGRPSKNRMSASNITI